MNKKRTSILVLSIITLVLLLGAIGTYAAGLITKNSQFVGFVQLNINLWNQIKAVGDPKQQVRSISLIVIAALAVVIAIIELVVNCTRKKFWLGFGIFLLFIVSAYVLAVEQVWFWNTIYPLMEAKQKCVLSGISYGCSVFAVILGLVTIVVDFFTGRKVENPIAVEAPIEAPINETKVEVAPIVEEQAKVNETVVVAPVVEAPIKKEAKKAAPSKKVAEKKVANNAAVKKDDVKKVESKTKTTTIKKDDVKKASTKTTTVKKADVKKAEAKSATTTIKKDDVKKASTKTTTIKKADVKKEEAKSATTTIKKDDVKKATVTNEEGVTYGKAYHVSKRADLNKWQVKATGASKAIKMFNTQKEANNYADQLAANQGATVRVHTKEGKIRKHNSSVKNEEK